MNFGDRLIYSRKKNNIDRKDLAKALSIPYTTLRNYETNVREPGHKFLIAISTYFNVTIDYLLCLTDNEYASGCGKNKIEISNEAYKIALAYDKADNKAKNMAKLALDVENPTTIKIAKTEFANDDNMDEDIKEELDRYRAELEAEKKGKISIA